METVTLPEEEFFEFHDRIKARGAYIIRCHQIDSGYERLFRLVYIIRG